MNFQRASIIFAIGIAGLFYLDRDKSLKTSKALWIPVIWIWIIGSRPVSVWLGVGPSGQGLDQQLDGSPFDALVFLALLIAAVVVLVRRKALAVPLLKTCGPILIYFAYCLLSVLWAAYSEVAFKRWVKDIGDLMMALIVVTEAEPGSAIQRLFSRVGFILLPTSVLLIKYSDLGHTIDMWGDFFNTGVTTNKNSLGLLVWIFSLGAVWNVHMLLRAKGAPNRKRRLLAQATLIAFGILLLGMAHSATSISCFILGTTLILATGLKSIRNRPSAVHALTFAILLVGGLTMLLGGEGAAIHALGRKENFTGRSDIWKAVIPAAKDPIFGAGFESFWISPDLLDRLYQQLPGWPRGLNTAHNGYIETYLNLGWVGICLIAVILISGYMRAVACFRRDPATGGLALAFVATAMIYNITEAGFRMLTLSWVFLLLVFVNASGLSRGHLRAQSSTKPIRRRMRHYGRSIAPSGPGPLAKGEQDSLEVMGWSQAGEIASTVTSRQIR